GRTVRLRHGYVVRCDEVVTNAAGDVVKLQCSAYLDANGSPMSSAQGSGIGTAPAGVKVWATLHWVSRTHGVPLTARLYERLFTEPDPEAGGEAFIDNLDPDSERVVTGLIEPSVTGDDPDTRHQFERLGYFWRDPVDNRPASLVFNRIVALKDGFATRRGKAAPRTRRGARPATTGPATGAQCAAAPDDAAARAAATAAAAGAGARLGAGEATPPPSPAAPRLA